MTFRCKSRHDSTHKTQECAKSYSRVVHEIKNSSNKCEVEELTVYFKTQLLAIQSQLCQLILPPFIKGGFSPLSGGLLEPRNAYKRWSSNRRPINATGDSHGIYSNWIQIQPLFPCTSQHKVSQIQCAFLFLCELCLLPLNSIKV